MKFVAFLAIALMGTTLAQQIPSPIEDLFRPHNEDKSFFAALERATRAGIDAQTQLEAKFLHGVRLNRYNDIAALVPLLDKHFESFDKEKSRICSSKEEWQSLVLYSRAVSAMLRGEDAEMKSSITEAFWLNPEQAGLFSELVASHRKRQALKKLNVPMDTQLITSKGDISSMAPLMKDRKAIVLQFWATWSEPCMQLVSEIPKVAALLQSHDIGFAAINTEHEPKKAEAVRIKNQIKDVAWLVEPASEPLTKLLTIDTLPRTVVVSPEGKVLFDGHPLEPGLWTVLSQINPSITPPES